jgi:hypothetical protein
MWAPAPPGKCAARRRAMYWPGVSVLAVILSCHAFRLQAPSSCPALRRAVSRTKPSSHRPLGGLTWETLRFSGVAAGYVIPVRIGDPSSSKALAWT